MVWKEKGGRVTLIHSLIFRRMKLENEKKKSMLQKVRKKKTNE
jgi:hypothetical protein